MRRLVKRCEQVHKHEALRHHGGQEPQTVRRCEQQGRDDERQDVRHQEQQALPVVPPAEIAQQRPRHETSCPHRRRGDGVLRHRHYLYPVAGECP